MIASHIPILLHLRIDTPADRSSTAPASCPHIQQPQRGLYETSTRHGADCTSAVFYVDVLRDAGTNACCCIRHGCLSRALCEGRRWPGRSASEGAPAGGPEGSDGFALSV